MSQVQITGSVCFAFHVAFSCYFACADETVEVEDRIPTELVEHLEQFIAEQCHDALLTEQRAQIQLRYRMRDFFLYSQLKNGRRHESRIQEGPDEDGLFVTLTRRGPAWRQEFESGPFGAFFAGSEFPSNFWKRYINLYELEDESGYIELQCMYGERCDHDLISGIRGMLTMVGEEVYKRDPDDWEKIANDIRMRVDGVIADPVEVTVWHQNRRTWTGHYKAKKYDIHNVDQEGHIADSAVRETGPQDDGVIIQIGPVDCRTEAVTSPLYGKEQKFYWDHYYVVGKVKSGSGEQIRLDLYYGKQTNRELLQKLVDAVEEYVTMPSRF